MPNPSSASASSSVDRRAISDHLHLSRGAGPQACRREANARHGDADLAAALVLALGIGPGARVLDVGCGTGEIALRLGEAAGPSGRVAAYDYAPAAVEAARARGVRAEVADAARLPEEDGAADALLCAYAVYYLPDLGAAVAEWRRVLRPGGRLVVAGPAADSNAELYAFHRAASGRGPGDADRLALGFVAGEAAGALGSGGFDTTRSWTFVNVVDFPGVDELIRYWTATSLFARTVPPEEATDAVERGRRILEAGVIPRRVTKRTTVWEGVRR